MGTRSGISTGTSIGSGPGKGSGSQQGGSAGGVADTWELGLGGLEQPHPENSPGGCWLRLGGPGTPWGLPGHGQPGTGGRSLPPGEPLFHGEQETSGSFVGAAGGRSRLNGRLSGQTPLPRALRSLCPPGPAREGARCPRAGGEQWPGGGPAIVPLFTGLKSASVPSAAAAAEQRPRSPPAGQPGAGTA